MSELGDEDATGSYSIYFAEGDALAKQKQFQKAIETLTKARLRAMQLHFDSVAINAQLIAVTFSVKKCHSCLYAQAMDFKPEDRPCLVERSKCYLQLGDTTAALADAEASLKEDKTYHRVMFYYASHLLAILLYICNCMYSKPLIKPIGL